MLVCDTSSLIKLAKGDALSCLEQLFDYIVVPDAVRSECRTAPLPTALQQPFYKAHTASAAQVLNRMEQAGEGIEAALRANVLKDYNEI